MDYCTCVDVICRRIWTIITSLLDSVTAWKKCHAIVIYFTHYILRINGVIIFNYMKTIYRLANALSYMIKYCSLGPLRIICKNIRKSLSKTNISEVELKEYHHKKHVWYKPIIIRITFQPINVLLHCYM